MDGTRGYYAEWNKSVGEGQTLYGFIHLGNINNSEGIKGERRENEWEKSERVTKHERYLTLGNEQGVMEREVGGGWGDWVTDTEEDTWWDEHWVLCFMLANWTPIKKIYKKTPTKNPQMTRFEFAFDYPSLTISATSFTACSFSMLHALQFKEWNLLLNFDSCK